MKFLVFLEHYPKFADRAREAVMRSSTLTGEGACPLCGQALGDAFEEVQAHRKADLAEIEAESVAYIVCQAAGLHSAGYSFGYVAHWAGERYARDRLDARTHQPLVSRWRRHLRTTEYTGTGCALPLSSMGSRSFRRGKSSNTRSMMSLKSSDESSELSRRSNTSFSKRKRE